MPYAELFELTSHSPEQTRQIGYHLGQLLQAGDVICLSGDLGAGKTTLAGGIGQGWGAEYSLTSPTFVIVHEHKRPVDRQRLVHVDAYRIASEDDAESIGLEDIFAADRIALVEWAENIGTWLPADRLQIRLEIADPTPTPPHAWGGHQREGLSDKDEAYRHLIFEGQGTRCRELLAAVKKALIEAKDYAAGD